MPVPRRTPAARKAKPVTSNWPATLLAFAIDPMGRRRSLLGAPAAGSVLAFSDLDIGAAPSGNDVGFKLGVASYSLRKFPRAEAIRMIQRLGLKYVNIKSYHLPLDSTPVQIREARKEFEDAGLHIVGGGNIDFHKDDEADIRHKFEYARLAGIPLRVCAPTKITLPKMTAALFFLCFSAVCSTPQSPARTTADQRIQPWETNYVPPAPRRERLARHRGCTNWPVGRA